MHPQIRDYWITFSAPLEGVVDFMYLDARGWVSTGIGNKIDETAQEMSPPSDAERSTSLRLANEVTWTAGDHDAGEDEVAAAWDAVKARLDLAASGHRAFESLTNLRLASTEIERLVLGKLDQMEQFLVGRPEFTNFAAWPANAQLATLSMCWALGPAFRFPNFQQHVAVESWVGAAEECSFGPRVGTIVIRNALDRDHFLLADRVASEGLPIESIALDVSTVFGIQGALIALGFRPGAQDGADGPSTQGGVRSFEEANGLSPTGSSTDLTMLATLGARLDEAGFTVLGI
ncbi:peptidoglycan-binding domain-containing protein [Nocardioides sp. 503]|uniref:peptidoglycan-binding domain-containing protein n=1 Tax=Nocardioides sp. 503 TaxID=2508326 RepID=UPI0010701CD2|nr:peptidoglycan-binding domain-containing protein [Nocardioides sp. 503]